MKPYIQAATAGELRDKLDADLRWITHMKMISDTEWNERGQLRAFLKAVADEDFISFPLEIFPSRAILRSRWRTSHSQSPADLTESSRGIRQSELQPQ